MCLWEIGYGDEDWIELSTNEVQWRISDIRRWTLGSSTTAIYWTILCFQLNTIWGSFLISYLGIRFSAGAIMGFFSLHHRVQTGPGDHPASCSMSYRGPFSGDEAAVACTWPLTSIYYRD